MDTPTVILLNGTSSAGKTSIARSLQHVMNAPYLYVSADTFTSMLPPYREGLNWIVEDILDTLRFGFYSSLASLVASGNYVVADHVIVRAELMKDCATKLAGYRAFLIGVRCPCEIAQQRERERGDRKIGLVQEQFDKVHQHGVYDLEVDTSLLCPDESALLISTFVATHEPAAFKRLRE